MKKVVLFLWLLIPLASSWAWAEDAAWTFDVGTNVAVGGGEHAPFWLTANRHGLVSMERNSAYLRTSAFRDYRKTKGFDWECGIDAAFGTLNNINIGIGGSDASGWGGPQFVLQQCYAGVRYGCWQLTAGSREHAS